MSSVVLASDLAAALGVCVKTLTRWVRAERVPPPVPRANDVEWRRWPVAVAAEVVRAKGLPVPAEWQGSGQAS